MNMERKKILLVSMLSLISFMTFSQVKIGINPTQIVSGALFQIDGNSTITAPAKLIVAGTGNVGIGTANPTNTLHIFSTANPLRIQGVQVSTSSTDKGLAIDANGVIKIQLNDQSSFSGYTSINVAIAPTITKVIMNTKLVDKGNEYNTSTGVFTPLTSGIYVYEMQINIVSADGISANDSSYGSGAGDQGIMGFVDASTSKWIGRLQFEIPNANRSYFSKGVTQLTAGVGYYFALAGGMATTLVANSTGTSGTGISNYFSIQRIQ